MNFSLKRVSIICICLLSTLSMFSFDFAAVIGQQLTTPENGWKRIESTDPNFVLTGLTLEYRDVQSAGSCYVGGTVNSSVKFKFKGTDLRYIGGRWVGCSNSNNLVMFIDGVQKTTGTAYLESGERAQNVLMEVTGLTDRVHEVEIKSIAAGAWDIDAIDINSTGYLVNYNQPANVLATCVDGNIKIEWDSIPNASAYVVKRSTVQGGTYETVATTTTNSYLDKSIISNTKYYYVVSAIINGFESSNSIEVSATATVTPTIIGNSAILEITMTNGQIKEYSLNPEEITNFLNWYDSKAAGTGKAYFVIPKKNNVKPFITRKEFIQFDKIYSFEVKEYQD